MDWKNWLHDQITSHDEQNSKILQQIGGEKKAQSTRKLPWLTLKLCYRFFFHSNCKHQLWC